MKWNERLQILGAKKEVEQKAPKKQTKKTRNIKGWILF
jgi:hypothetical protein